MLHRPHLRSSPRLLTASTAEENSRLKQISAHTAGHGSTRSLTMKRGTSTNLRSLFRGRRSLKKRAGGNGFSENKSLFPAGSMHINYHIFVSDVWIPSITTLRGVSPRTYPPHYILFLASRGYRSFCSLPVDSFARFFCNYHVNKGTDMVIIPDTGLPNHGEPRGGEGRPISRS